MIQYLRGCFKAGMRAHEVRPYTGPGGRCGIRLCAGGPEKAAAAPGQEPRPRSRNRDGHSAGRGVRAGSGEEIGQGHLSRYPQMSASSRSQRGRVRQLPGPGTGVGAAVETGHRGQGALRQTQDLSHGIVLRRTGGVGSRPPFHARPPPGRPRRGWR